MVILLSGNPTRDIIHVVIKPILLYSSAFANQNTGFGRHCEGPCLKRVHVYIYKPKYQLKFQAFEWKHSTCSGDEHV